MHNKLSSRVALLIFIRPNLELTIIKFIVIFLIGLFYDLVVSSFFAIPVALYCWLMKDSWYQKKWQQIPLFILFAIITFIMVAIAGSEIVFWNEFNVRFNFIAVDYLIYTNEEVLGNIWESYNMALILSVVLLLVGLLLLLLRGKILASREVSMRFLKRLVFFLLFLLALTDIYFF